MVEFIRQGNSLVAPSNDGTAQLIDCRRVMLLINKTMSYVDEVDVNSYGRIYQARLRPSNRRVMLPV